MAIRLADTARPNNYVDAEHPGSFPVAYADDVWFADGTRLSEKSFDGQSIQVEELPLASANELGNIYQYVGETGTYTKGYFYECVSDGEVPPTYSWKEVSGGGYHFSEDFVKEEDEVSLAVSQRVFTGTQAEWDALSTAVKKTYGVVNITDDDSTSESIKDITNLLAKEEGYVSGNVYVKKLGHVVQLDFHSLVVSDYNLYIMSGFPKPIDHTNTFVLQGDGNPQTIGLAQISSNGVLTSGPETAGLVPGKLWDGTVMYLTND